MRSSSSLTLYEQCHVSASKYHSIGSIMRWIKNRANASNNPERIQHKDWGVRPHTSRNWMRKFEKGSRLYTGSNKSHRRLIKSIYSLWWMTRPVAYINGAKTGRLSVRTLWRVNMKLWGGCNIFSRCGSCLIFLRTTSQTLAVTPSLCSCFPFASPTARFFLTLMPNNECSPLSAIKHPVNYLSVRCSLVSPRAWRAWRELQVFAAAEWMINGRMDRGGQWT